MQLSKSMFLTTLILISASIISCSKDKIQNLSASSISSGRAGIKFTSSTAFNGSNEFEVVNTPESKTTVQTIATNVKTIKIETTERVNGTASRYVLINLLVYTNATGSMDCRVTGTGVSVTPPSSFVRMESYSLFGITRESSSGSLRITNLTNSEIEGTFNITMNEGMVITGSFAGKL